MYIRKNTIVGRINVSFYFYYIVYMFLASVWLWLKRFFWSLFQFHKEMEWIFQFEFSSSSLPKWNKNNGKNELKEDKNKNRKKTLQETTWPQRQNQQQDIRCQPCCDSHLTVISVITLCCLLCPAECFSLFILLCWIAIVIVRTACILTLLLSQLSIQIMNEKIRKFQRN